MNFILKFTIKINNFGYIFKKLEEEGVIGKIKDNLLQLKLDELNARMYRPKNDDESR